MIGSIALKSHKTKIDLKTLQRNMKHSFANLLKVLDHLAPQKSMHIVKCLNLHTCLSMEATQVFMLNVLLVRIGCRVIPATNHPFIKLEKLGSSHHTSRSAAPFALLCKIGLERQPRTRM